MARSGSPRRPTPISTAQSGPCRQQRARASGLRLPGIQHAKFLDRQMLDAVPCRAQIIQQNNLRHVQFRRQQLRVHRPRQIRCTHMIGNYRPGYAKTRGQHRVRCQMRRRQSRKLFYNQSNCANSLLANRLRNTGVSVPFFSANNAKLHFVPPTSPARITVPPVLISVANLRRHSRRILWVVPPSPTALQQKLRFSRPPASRRIYRHGLRFRRAPHI